METIDLCPVTDIAIWNTESLGNGQTGFMRKALLSNRQFKFSIVFGHEKPPKLVSNIWGSLHKRGLVEFFQAYRLRNHG